MKKLKNLAEQLRIYLFRPHFAACLIMAWFITNGWAYLGAVLGKLLKLPWLLGISTGYLAFLWMPMTPEKIITLMLAMSLSRILFPKDEDNLNLFRTLRRNLTRKTKQSENEDPVL
ncbi:MAG: hypothetical protein K6A14_08630 [Erysipelotrichaceae bacterium]|nr:hypothetical protein [Erysipelotrichaceae bacterium]